ncbi:MAG: response regulator transcription factor [Myxococcota bacterium]
MIRTIDETARAQLLLVEDTPELAHALLRLLNRAGLLVVHAGNFTEARAVIDDPASQFDAAILDHHLPDGDSRALVSALAQKEPGCSSLVLTGVGDPGLAKDYRGRGAFRYVAKPVKGAQLLAHVHATMLDTHRWRAAGMPTTYVPSPPAVVVDVEAAADRLRFLARLSPTEREVAYWLLQGLRDAQIARLLGRAERTAKRHVGQVLSKVGVQNRSSLWAVLRNDADHQPPSEVTTAL